MNNRTLVKLTATEKGISLKTISRERKSPWSFFASQGDLIALERDGHVVASDMFSFAEFQKNKANNTVAIYFTWLNNHGYKFVGWKQSIVLPYDTLMTFALDTNSRYRIWSTLSIEPKNSPKFVFECPEQLRKCVEHKIIRRKLVRFLRDNFKWWGADKICFYSDFEAYSFFFREFRNGIPGTAGGLIYHTGGDLSKGYYSIHT